MFRKKRRKVKIALAQIKYSFQGQENTNKIKLFIRKAKQAGAEIVCFPEACLHPSQQFHLSHSFIKQIQAECKKNNIWAIINDDLKMGKNFYNVALLINRQGRIAGHYKKINLYKGEEVKPGTKVKVFKTDFGKIGITICWDLNNPKLYQKLKKMGAEIVFCPARWCYESKAYDNKHMEREKEILKSLIKTRAFENILFLAVINPLIPGKYFSDLVSYSSVVCPHRTLKEIYKREGLLIAELDFKELHKAHKLYR